MSLITATVGPSSNSSSLRTFDALAALHADGVVDADDFLSRVVDRLDDDVAQGRVEELDALTHDPNVSVARSATLRLAALGHEPALEQLEQRANKNDPAAVAALLNIRHEDYQPSDEAASGVARALEAALARARSSIRPGTPWTFELALHVAARSGRADLWPDLLATLTDPAVGADEKTAVVLAMLRLDTGLPVTVQDELRGARGRIALGGHWDPTEREGSVEALKLAIGEVLDPETNPSAAASVCIAAREPLAREIGVAIALRRSRIAGDRRGAVLALQCLLADDDVIVQRTAVYGIVDIACHDDEQAAWLRDMLGTLDPLATRQATTRLVRHAKGADGQRARELLDSMVPHVDPFVQRLAQTLSHDANVPAFSRPDSAAT